MKTKLFARLLLAATVAAATVATSAPAALAAHDHYLVTTGTCVDDIARGQTSKTEGEGGYHQFHHNVHLGQPGHVAFANGGNVAVFRGTCPVAP